MKILNYLKDKGRFFIAFVVRWNAHRNGMWYCPECNKGVIGMDVAYDEEHDLRSGGCGHKVV